jgi:hypothetical protein
MDLRDPPAVHAMARDGLGPAGQLVWDFLTLFAERRYAEANAYLAPGCQMLFPGGAVFTDCTELPVRAASIYRWVKKVFERFDEHETPAGTVVYNYGGLFGEWLDGEPFAGALHRPVPRAGRPDRRPEGLERSVPGRRRPRAQLGIQSSSCLAISIRWISEEPSPTR